MADDNVTIEPLSNNGGNSGDVREGESLIPKNNLGPGWYFIPLGDPTPIEPHTEDQRRVMEGLAAGRTVFQMLNLVPEQSVAVADEDVSAPGQVEEA